MEKPNVSGMGSKKEKGPTFSRFCNLSAERPLKAVERRGWALIYKVHVSPSLRLHEAFIAPTLNFFKVTDVIDKTFSLEVQKPCYYVQIIIITYTEILNKHI